MSIINVDSISDAAGTGSPSFPNGMSLNSLTTTGVVTASGITVDNTNPTIKSADADGFLNLSGGTTGTVGTQIRLYAESHATAANDITFRSGGSAVLQYNASTPVWNFQAEDITTTGTVTATDFAGDGSALTGVTTLGTTYSTPTRAGGNTAHQNTGTTFKIVMVDATGQADSLSVSADNVTWYQVYYWSGGNGSYERASATLIVPPNHYWRFSGSSVYGIVEIS